MSRICEVTGKAGLVGNMVSHSNRKKLMKQLLQHVQQQV